MKLISLFFLFTFALLLPIQSTAQSVSVGSGSYTLTLPDGEVGPQNSNGAPIQPKISSEFNQRIQTNDFWSSLIFPFFSNPHSNVMHAHPLNYEAVSTGLELGYNPTYIFAASDYLYPHQSHLKVSVTGLNVPQTVTDAYSDWTVTALWQGSNQSMKATLGHGLPFSFYEISGGDARIEAAGATVWHNRDGVLGLRISGQTYAIFAPSTASWTTSSPYVSNLDGKSYFSVALLPDQTPETLEEFRQRAYAHVTDSRVDWEFNESTSELQTTYRYTTELKETGEEFINETITALYRHQWLVANEAVLEKTYQTARGVMKLRLGNEFSTTLVFTGILPSLPDEGDYNRNELNSLVDQIAEETLPIGPTYENGKAMGRFARLVEIAHQMGNTSARDHFLSELKRRLESWLTADGEQQYMYNTDWDVLTGYPSGFGADNQINDHHFHASYAIMSAAIVAQYDPEWAQQDRWGGMINLLIRDANNWQRDDPMFPFLRSHDAYAGHSWAAGHAGFREGNNQESSSESMNFATATFLWGTMTDQKEIRDLGIFLHTNEAIAIDQYWFDVDEEVFPETYPHVALGMVWGGKGVHSTWFGANPEFIHGINFLPITSGSLYLGRNPEYVVKNYDEILAETGGQITLWKDVLWEYLALGDPDRAMSLFLQDPTYTPFDGETKAHTLHWLGNLKRIGQMDPTVTADIPTYSVFNKNGTKTYAAFNPNQDQRLVTFSDGFTLTVPPRSLESTNTTLQDVDAPVAQLIVDKTTGKIPLTIAFTGSKSFDRKESPLTFQWDFGFYGRTATADTSITFREEDEFWVSLTVTNDLGLTDTDSVYIRISGNGTPYLGNPVLIPGTLQAENYDIGGEGISYHDVDPNNIGLVYRPDEGVDLEPSGGGYNVYWMVDGEWLEYTFEVEEAGEFDILPYVSTVPGFGELQLKIDNDPISEKLPVTSTGGWQNFTPLSLPPVSISEGVHILRVEVSSPSDKKGWLYSLNRIELKRSSTVSTEDVPLPISFEVHQNYPNPFNPTTQVTFSLPGASSVAIEMYDISGRIVRSIQTNTQYAAGTHQHTIDGSGLPSGLYFLQVRSVFGQQTIKMTLIK